ncbi:tRNA lysidine(34) synthetase TilS [Mycoplasma iguanae]|uniref:tRNA(Ile)-lysidine synthase n=1 Tax=Mycoplasma iguanae TaxID=292461 RepID=A0ABY5RBM4_9MOLU|nr:tRNA lysidine(34) synthetase TilS [Mycoplasma iguanae]UVD81747.1 tRNA lysidine(34) synthetase TilS [Mycoplasma iguanae]
MKNIKKILLAVSGGPDSMYLLWKYRKANVIVAHVNYNKRSDSHLDQEIVENFCKKYNIPLFIKKIKKNIEVKNNFQNWAREERYSFFSEIYHREKCDFLYLAHHKDDFIETAYFQKSTNRQPRYYGIPFHTIYKNMEIIRPLLLILWKNQISKKLINKNIAFSIDSTNVEPIYTRNKIRLYLATKSIFYKEAIFMLTWITNFLKFFINKKLSYDYKKWEKNNFDSRVFTKFKNKNKLVFLLINNYCINVKLTSKKIQGITDFITASRGSKFFILNSKYLIEKKYNRIKIMKKE